MLAEERAEALDEADLSRSAPVITCQSPSNPVLHENRRVDWRGTEANDNRRGLPSLLHEFTAPPPPLFV